MGPHGSRIRFLLFAFCALLLAGCTPAPPYEFPDHAPGLAPIGSHTLVGPKNLLRDYPPIDDSGLLNVVVEIPTGTSAKWEVDKSTGHLEWNLRDGKPRVVAYLPYPGNYGMVPRSSLPMALGGDGDPLDVIVLGPAVPRGSVVQARLLGVLKMLDAGEHDDKLIAVPQDSALGQVEDLDALTREFPGVTEIIETWFENYQGPGTVELQGYGDLAEAEAILQAAIAAYRER